VNSSNDLCYDQQDSMNSIDKKLIKTYINEVLAGFDNKSAGKDGVPSNLHFGGNTVGDVPVRSNTNVLDDESNEQQTSEQGSKQAACCLIMGHDGTVLAVSRRNDPSAMGLAGGKVDPGETAMEAAARELYEETGLTATKLTQVFSSRDGQGFVTTTFACEVEGEINTEESGVVKWVHPSVLINSTSSPFADYNVKLFAKLGMK